jgi:hypothetical protein
MRNKQFINCAFCLIHTPVLIVDFGLKEMTMEQITYGLLNNETREFISSGDYSYWRLGHRGQGGTRERDKRYESDDLSSVADVFKSSIHNNRTAFGSYEIDDLSPVAFLKSSDGFNKSEEVKQIDLSEVISCKVLGSRSIKDTPDILLRSRFDAGVLADIKENSLEFLFVKPNDDFDVSKGSILYLDGTANGLAVISQTLNGFDDWPTTSKFADLEGWTAVLVNNDVTHVSELLPLNDIVSSAPSLTI